MKRKVQRISSYITDQLQMIDGFHSVLRDYSEYAPGRKQEIAEFTTRSMINLM